MGEHLRRTEEHNGSRLRSFSDLTVVGSQSADDALVALSERLIEGKSQATIYPNCARKATAWLLIVSAIVAGLSSLASMIANWKSAREVERNKTRSMLNLES